MNSNEARGQGASMPSTDAHHHSPAAPTPTQNGNPDPSPSSDLAQLLRVTTNSLSPSATNKKGLTIVAYKECLKNHAAALGGNATDGCGEFMPAGEDGSLDALHCSACGCHRNFHRKEVDGSGGMGSSSPPYFLPQCHQTKGVLRTRCGPLSLEVPQAGAGMGPTAPLGSDRFEVGGKGGGNKELAPAEGRSQQRVELGVNKKRFRTKFTKEQKEKLLGFAEKAGWKIQKLDEGIVQNFCQVVGIKRRVLKVWMHNNKQHYVKTDINSPANNYDNNCISNCSDSELAS